LKRKDKLKEKAIIENTLNIVSQTGIAGIKMSKLAKRVGISPSTLYVYFETKEDLIVSIGFKILEKISKSLQAALDEHDNFEQKLRVKWIHMLQFRINNEKEINFMEHWMQSPFFDKSSFKQKGDKLKPKTNLFQEGRDSGFLKELDDHIIHAVISGMAKQFSVLIKEGHLKMNQQTIDLTFCVVRDALKK